MSEDGVLTSSNRPAGGLFAPLYVGKPARLGNTPARQNAKQPPFAISQNRDDHAAQRGEK